MFKNYLKVRLPDGTLVQARVIGLDDATLAGGPPELVHGRLEDLRRDRAVFINAAQAGESLRLRRDGDRPLDVGDRVSVNDNDAVVAGTYRATREFFWEPVLYTTYSRALSWAPRERKLLSYVLVKVAEGVDPQAVADRITAETGLAAKTNRQFERQTTMDIISRTGILINFGITIGLGFVIGLLVAGQTFYTFVLDNLRPFASLKAMGASNAIVLRMLCVQVVVVGLIGYGLGLGGASVTGLLLSRGGLAFQMPWQIPVVGAVAVLACCLAAGALGMVRVLRLEPAVVFK
jgi:putative ABC transport system permease protein